jgi:hypothetical protein
MAKFDTKQNEQVDMREVAETEDSGPGSSLVLNLADAQAQAGFLPNADRLTLGSVLRENGLLPVFTFVTGAAMLNLNILSLTREGDSLTLGIPCEPKVDDLDEAKAQLLRMALAL